MFLLDDVQSIIVNVFNAESTAVGAVLTEMFDDLLVPSRMIAIADYGVF